MRLIVAVLGATALAALTSTALAEPVTAERLVNAASEPQNWFMKNGSYDSYEHSTLSQINRENVGELAFKYAVALGGYTNTRRGVTQEATPLVVDGAMYVNNAWGQTYKIDVTSGREGQVLWKFDPEVDPGYPDITTSRGIAVLGNNVYINTLDSRLIAVDMESGESVFEARISSPDDFQNQQHTGAPLAVKDMILVGQSNGFVGNRGWLAGFDATNGDLRWRFFSIPGPGEPGNETWTDDHNAWRTGGGAVWTTPSYDPESELVHYGTGDAAPWHDPEFRPGDNLFAISSLAVDVNTGALKWYFQETPNESWDFDTVSSRLLYEIPVNGQNVKVVGNFGRNGYYYTLDRATGEFYRADQYVPKITWTAGIDPKTGKPVEYDPALQLQEYAGHATRRNRPATDICPNTGNATYFPPSFDPTRMVAYIGGQNGCTTLTITEPMDFNTDWRGITLCCRSSTASGPVNGHITAVDVVTGETKASVTFAQSVRSGVITTGGDLLFAGHLDGKVAAYDSDTLEQLWYLSMGTPVNAPPITFAIGDQQYVAIVAGGSLNGSANPLLQGAATLYVFGL